MQVSVDQIPALAAAIEANKFSHLPACYDNFIVPKRSAKSCGTFTVKTRKAIEAAREPAQEPQQLARKMQSARVSQQYQPSLSDQDWGDDD